MNLPSLWGGKRKRRPATRKKSTARKKKRATGLSSGWAWVVGTALVLLVGGIGLLKWSETRTGQATLLTLGSDKMFGEVQAAVELAVAPVLPGFQGGVETIAAVGDVDAHDWPAPQLGPAAQVRCRLVPVASARPWPEIQLTIQQAVAASGARILWAERLPAPDSRSGQQRPEEDQDLLRMDLGVAGKPTHTLVLFRQGRRPAVRWGGGRRQTAWSTLAADLSTPTVALLIDDWGYSRSDATGQLLGLPAPITLAVLPNLPYSRHFALVATDLILPDGASLNQGDGPADGRDLRLAAGCFVEVRLSQGPARWSERRREIMLHLPMEPQGYPEVNPGSDAILVGMGRSEIAAQVDQALQSLPNVRGVNNHMGSAATSDAGTMGDLMSVLAARDLFFVDSLTSNRSVAYDQALAAGMPAQKNRIFLDYDNEDAAKIAANLERLVQSARSRGFALGIGHPHPATAQVLAREIPRLKAAGVRFVTVSELLALQAAAQGTDTP